MISDSIPIELILEILLRLPAKSIARFHCVSKLWASMLRGPYFTEKFLTRSSAQPRLLLALEENGLWSFYSLPQHLSPYEKSLSSSRVVATKFHIKFPPDNMRIYERRFYYGYASGLIYFDGMSIIGKDHYSVSAICNPITGRYVSLPCLKRNRKGYSFFGFDPIDKQFKVLLMASLFGPDRHKILTFRTGKMRWRNINCSLTHVIVGEGICINGVLYYLGEIHGDRTSHVVIVCFDVRSEKFSFIYPETYCGLINYKGKLGLVYDDDDTNKLRVWVLEDVEEQKWSKYAYTLRDDKFSEQCISVVGVTATGEIVLSMADYTSKQPFYVSYLNPERNTLQRVDIQGLEYHKERHNLSIHFFINHVEDLNVNDPKLFKSSIYAPYLKTEEEESEEGEDEEDEEDEEGQESEAGEK